MAPIPYPQEFRSKGKLEPGHPTGKAPLLAWYKVTAEFQMSGFPPYLGALSPPTAQSLEIMKGLHKCPASP